LCNAQSTPSYQNPLRFQQDIQWFVREGYRIVEGNPGSGLAQVTPKCLEAIHSHMLPGEWGPSGHQLGRAAWVKDRNSEKERNRKPVTENHQKGGRSMTRRGWAAVIVAGAIVVFLFYHFWK